MTMHSSIKGKLIAVIGDEDTCVGFLLGGIGEINKNRQPNFFVVDKNTSISEIEETFKKFIRRDDIDIILINQNACSPPKNSDNLFWRIFNMIRACDFIINSRKI
ncbi:V-type proton ATPase subunit F [Orchesella cincta]|uniref:V-type proton ATPase subunit F n=1 Tax=Orchesella cincta TaxID=48709 RepID=A0A1D2NAD6_ORCCI|nr:V-type proton ATPase subunit F [Orchesella cincta]